MNSNMVAKTAVVSAARFMPAPGTPPVSSFFENAPLVMSKPTEPITEIIRDPKHSFRKADDRPAKAQRHRYERRKIKGYLKQSDWAEDGSA
jgi:hypothetical protein